MRSFKKFMALSLHLQAATRLRSAWEHAALLSLAIQTQSASARHTSSGIT